MSAVLVQSPSAEEFRATGRATGLRVPQFQFYGSAFLSSTSSHHLFMYILPSTNEEQTYIVASVLLTVCGNLGPHQSKVLCVTRDMHGKDMPFPSRPFLSSRTSACVNNSQTCCPHSSEKICQGFLNGRLGYSEFWP